MLVLSDEQNGQLGAMQIWSHGHLVVTGCYKGGVAIPHANGVSQVPLLPELLLQDVSVLIKATVDASHFPAFTHPQLLAYQANQTFVM